MVFSYVNKVLKTGQKRAENQRKYLKKPSLNNYMSSKLNQIEWLVSAAFYDEVAGL